MRVIVAYAGPEGEAVDSVELPDGAPLAEALAHSGILLRFGLDPGRIDCAIHGQRARPGTPLREGDRVELLRPLCADPKDARRRRAKEKPLARPVPTPRQPRKAR